MNAEETRIVRKALGSGRWFPGGGGPLKTMVETFINEAESQGIKGRLAAAVSPHAGYVYSGRVAGYTFRALKENAAAGHEPGTVVVLGFSHRMGFGGVALMDGNALATPLGTTDLDREAAAFLVAQGSRIRMNYQPHAGEHSAENQVPFIQVALPKSKLVVGIIGDHDPATITDLVDALAKLAKEKKIVVVASTDLLHDADYDRVTKSDKVTLKKVGAMDHAGILKSWDFSNRSCAGSPRSWRPCVLPRRRGARKAPCFSTATVATIIPRAVGAGSWATGRWSSPRRSRA
ncbi:MAG: AmmeMemoRadiSam system protein B [Lentisphaerae bacterium]|nr:AmmeMemoRadiSam system protein B [Lentisphaerota bacterium]